MFKTIIPLHTVTLGPFINKWLKWLELNEKSSVHLEKSLQKIQLNTALSNASWDELILHLVPSWNQKGTKHDVLRWPSNQVFTEEEVKKVPSWSQKSTKLVHKKIRYIISILSLTAEPISLEDLMSAIGYSNKKTFRDNYIKPLEQLKFITKTDLVNLTSPDQKYKLTKLGELFLGDQSETV